MERRNLAPLLCAGWSASGCLRWPLGHGTGQRGLRAATTGKCRQPVRPDGRLTAAAQPQVFPLPCRAAIPGGPGPAARVLTKKNPDERVPIASITKLMTLLLTFEAVHAGG